MRRKELFFENNNKIKMGLIPLDTLLDLSLLSIIIKILKSD